MIETLHSVYSPSFPGGLAVACECAEKQHFALLRVVVTSPYEAVAVFERDNDVAGSSQEAAQEGPKA